MPTNLNDRRLTVGAILLPLLSVAAAGCGSGEQQGVAPPPRVSSTRTTESGAHRPFIAHLTAATHTPVVGKLWPWSVRVESNGGEPLGGRTKVRFLFGGRIVGHGNEARFLGTRRETIRWPRRSVGFPLTFRVVVTTVKGTVDLDYPVQVRRR